MMMQSRLTTIHRLPIAYPPDFLRAIGYTGTSRYVAVQYLGSKLVFNDGRGNSTGSWWPYSEMLRFPPVAEVLYQIGAHLGYDEEYPADYLLFDAEEQTVSVGPIQTVEAMLRSQWPAFEPKVYVLSRAEWDALTRQAIEQSRRTPEEATRMMAEERAAEERFRTWLAQQARVN